MLLRPAGWNSDFNHYFVCGAGGGGTCFNNSFVCGAGGAGGAHISIIILYVGWDGVGKQH